VDLARLLSAQRPGVGGERRDRASEARRFPVKPSIRAYAEHMRKAARLRESRDRIPRPETRARRLPKTRPIFGFHKGFRRAWMRRRWLRLRRLFRRSQYA
jgi:hypothetical protein